MPDDEIDTWLAAEAAWAATNLALVQAAYQWFMEHGEWPEVAKLRRQFVQSGHDVDVHSVLHDRPAPPSGLGLELSEDRVTLRTSDLLGVREAAQLLNLAVEVAKQAVDNYRTHGVDPVVHSTDPAVTDYITVISRNLPARGSQLILQRLPRFLLSDYPRPVNGGAAIDTTSWQLSINEDDVMAFDDVGALRTMCNGKPGSLASGSQRVALRQ